MGNSFPTSRGPQCWYQPRMSETGLNELLIYGEVGGWGVGAKEFREDLLAVSAMSPLGVRIRINSPGGDMFTGLAIYNCIKSLGRPVEMVIDSVAASAASLIAMAGKPVIMPRNTFMMLHNPFMEVIGDGDDLLSAAEYLKMFSGAMANIYADKSGQTQADMLVIMSNETWLTADDALQLGMCDRVVDSVQIAACAGLTKFKSTPQTLLTKGNTRMTDVPNVGIEAEEAAKAKAAKKAKKEAKAEAKHAAKAEAKVTARVEKIASICKLAGRPEMAAGFIAEGKSPKEALALLTSEPNREEINTTVTTRQQRSADADLDPRRIYAHWNSCRGQKVPRNFVDLDSIMEKMAGR